MGFSGGKIESNIGYPMWTPKGSGSANPCRTSKTLIAKSTAPQLTKKRKHTARTCGAEVREQSKLKPGEVLVCQDSFADVADHISRIRSRALGPEFLPAGAGIVDDLKAFFTGKLAEVTSSQVSDFVTERLGKVSK